MPFVQFIIPEIICLIFGVVSILIVFKGWKSDRSKPLMIAFLILSFAVPAFLGMILFVLSQVDMPNGIARFLYSTPWASGILASLVLFAYILLRTQDSSEPVLAPPKNFGELNSSDVTSPMILPYAGPVWDTQIADQKTATGIMRKRECAFILDFVPALFGAIAVMAQRSAGVLPIPD